MYLGTLAFGLTSCDPGDIAMQELPDDSDDLLGESKKDQSEGSISQGKWVNNGKYQSEGSIWRGGANNEKDDLEESLRELTDQWSR